MTKEHGAQMLLPPDRDTAHARACSWENPCSYHSVYKSTTQGECTPNSQVTQPTIEETLNGVECKHCGCIAGLHEHEQENVTCLEHANPNDPGGMCPGFEGEG